MRDLNRDLELVKHFEDRKARALARLQQISGRKFYFALVGFNTEVDNFTFGRFAWLEPVVEPPGVVELASAADNSLLFAAAGRWSPLITHEIVLDREFVNDDQKALDVAWAIVSALRIRTLVPFLVPAYADRSWSTICAFDDHSVKVRLLEDYPLASMLGEKATVRLEDLQWIYDHLPVFVKLNHAASFKVAVEALSTYHYASSFRMMAACLWVGIDAVFGVTTETGFRISLYAASLLEPNGGSRKSLFDTLRDLYRIRNKAVHGGNVSEDELTQNIVAIRQILSRILCRIVEIGHLPSNQEYEELLLLT